MGFWKSTSHTVWPGYVYFRFAQVTSIFELVHLFGPKASSRPFRELSRWTPMKSHSQHSTHHLIKLAIVCMKIHIIFVGISIADSMLPATTCATLNGDFGASLKCPYDSGYVVGFCSSGKNKYCVNQGSHSHQYKCCNEHAVTVDLNRCEVQYPRHGFVNVRT